MTRTFNRGLAAFAVAGLAAGAFAMSATAAPTPSATPSTSATPSASATAKPTAPSPTAATPTVTDTVTYPTAKFEDKVDGDKITGTIALTKNAPAVLDDGTKVKYMISQVNVLGPYAPGEPVGGDACAFASLDDVNSRALGEFANTEIKADEATPYLNTTSDFFKEAGCYVTMVKVAAVNADTDAPIWSLDFRGYATETKPSGMETLDPVPDTPTPLPPGQNGEGSDVRPGLAHAGGVN